LFAALSIAAVAAGCKMAVQTYGPTDTSSIDHAVLTADGTDSYAYASAPANVAVSAVDTSSDNLREVFWPADGPSVGDSQSCATWSAETDMYLQQGAALRIVQNGSDTRAITVTKDIWMGGVWIFNFHVWDSSQSPPYLNFGHTDLHDLLVHDGVVTPMPWHFCARVIGEVVEFKVWTGDELEPAWGDATHGGSATLPAGWDAPGETGWYVGHLKSNDSAIFSDLSTYKYVGN
jgi:hypothetical protein